MFYLYIIYFFYNFFIYIIIFYKKLYISYLRLYKKFQALDLFDNINLIVNIVYIKKKRFLSYKNYFLIYSTV